MPCRAESPKKRARVLAQQMFFSEGFAFGRGTPCARFDVQAARVCTVRLVRQSRVESLHGLDGAAKRITLRFQISVGAVFLHNGFYCECGFMNSFVRVIWAGVRYAGALLKLNQSMPCLANPWRGIHLLLHVEVTLTVRFCDLGESIPSCCGRYTLKKSGYRKERKSHTSVCQFRTVRFIHH